MTVKASSPEIVHKTELGGIFLNVHDLCELEEKYDLLASKFPAAEVLVETMEAPGPEVIIGLMDDPAFGQCIMFGMGGVQAEFYNDAAFRTVPIMRHDAKEMISETKASAFFRGFRGLRADQGAMVDLLCRISELALAHHESIAQLDLNPVILREQGYVVVDAKLKLRRDISQDRAVEGDRGREEHQGE
jgi:acetyltransferase